MGAMGAQALTALREPTDIRLVTEQGKYLAIEKDTFPDNLTDAPPIGVPVIAAVPARLRPRGRTAGRRAGRTGDAARAGHGP